MTIKFNFELSDQDAELLFSFIQNDILKMNEYIMEEMVGENREKYIKWYEHQIEHVMKMKKYISESSTRMDDEIEDY